MQEDLQQVTNEAIVIPKKLLLSFIAGVVFTASVGLAAQRITQSNPQTQESIDNQNVGVNQATPTTKKVDIKNVTFVKAYPNFGEYKGLPVGPWLNLENNIIPDIRGNVAIITHIVHYQGFTKRTLPVLQDIYNQNKDKDTVVIAINNRYLGQPDETDYAKVQQTLSEERVTFPVVIDSENASSNFAGTFNNNAYPGILIVDKFGNVRYVHPGATDFEKLNIVVKDIQAEEKQSPPTIESLVDAHKEELLKSKNLQSAFSIEESVMSSIGDSPFYLVGIRIFKREVDKSKMLRGEDLEDAIIILGKTSEGEWIVGIPHDDNYCAMLKQANLSEKDWKSYEMIKCTAKE